MTYLYRVPGRVARGMIFIGLLLIVLGLIVPSLSILFTIGIIVLVIGLVLLALGQFGHPVAGRRWYW
jgi:hypothetical protein